MASTLDGQQGTDSAKVIGLIKEESGPPRKLKGPLGKLVTVLAISLSVYTLLYVSHALEYLGQYMLDVTYLALYLTFGLPLLFLCYPASKRAPRDRVPWYDVLIIVLAVAISFYIFLFYQKEMGYFRLGVLNPFDVVIGFLLMAILIEAARRALGITIPIVALFFIIHPLILGNNLPGFLYSLRFSFGRVSNELVFNSVGVFGTVLGTLATLVAIYLIFSQFLMATGAGEFFIKFAYSFLGHLTGGPAKVAVVGSGLVGTMTGSGAANVALTGVFTIPLMKRGGFRPEFAGAVEASAGQGAMIMPPILGAAAFIMAEWLGVPYAEIAVACLLPALLFFFGLFIMVHLEATKKGLVGLPRKELPSVKETLKGGWHYIVPLAGLVVLLMVLMYSAEAAALYSLVLLIIVSMFRKKSRIGIRQVANALRGASIGMLQMIAVSGVAGIIVASFQLTGLGPSLSAGMVEFSGGHVFIILILGAIAAFIFGMGMVPVTAYLMVAIFVAPSLSSLGIPPLVAHLFVFYFSLTANITPPVCVGAFIAAAIAGADPNKTGWTATRLSLVTFLIPFAFAYNQAFILKGSINDIILAVVAGFIGVAMLASVLEGYLLTNISWWERILLLAGSLILLFVPSWLVTAIVVGVSLIVVIRQRQLVKALRKVPVPIDQG